MVAAETTSSGKAKRYKSWRTALTYALKGTNWDRRISFYDAKGNRRADSDKRAEEFSLDYPEDARRTLLELAEGASDVGDLEAMRLYLGFIADMQEWCSMPNRDPWEPEAHEEPEATMTTHEAAKLLGVSTRYVRKLYECGKIRGRLLTPRLLLVSQEDVEGRQRREEGEDSRR